MVREDFLQQNAFLDVDSYSSYDRQAKLLALILRYDALCRKALEQDVALSSLLELPEREQIGRAKTVPADQYAAEYEKIDQGFATRIQALIEEGGMAE